MVTSRDGARLQAGDRAEGWRLIRQGKLTPRKDHDRMTALELRWRVPGEVTGYRRGRRTGMPIKQSRDVKTYLEGRKYPRPAIKGRGWPPVPVRRGLCTSDRSGGTGWPPIPRDERGHSREKSPLPLATDHGQPRHWDH